MPKILIINGSLRNGQTDRAVEIFKDKLGSGFEYEVLKLRDMDIKNCKGCALCLHQGEGSCPVKDDLPLVIEKMDKADCIVFATPNFALNVTWIMKNLLDRLAFVYHRPRFFGKVFSSIVTQGVYGGGQLNKFFKTTAEFWGGIYVKGTVLTLVSAAYKPSAPWSEKEQQTVEKEMVKLAGRLKKALSGKLLPSPSLFRLMIFRFTRSAHKYGKEDNMDFRTYRDKGWFESDYFYPVRLGPVKKLAGFFADLMIKKMAEKKKR